MNCFESMWGKMSWEPATLLAKAKLFFERALEHDRDDSRFGLWCALGLELLARAAVASVSPALLAEPDRDHRYLLHALGRGDPRQGARSLGAAQVFRLCERLFDGFKSEQTTAALALINRRNEELHTGSDAFNDYTTQHWVPGFYTCCRALVIPLSESVGSLLGEAEAGEAEQVLAQEAQEVRERVNQRIARYRGVFEDRPDAEREAAHTEAEAAVKRLVHQHHHKVSCPACKSAATLQGDHLGTAKVQNDDEERLILVKQAISPRRFSCTSCGLRFGSYAELVAAGLGDQYTRTTWYSPEEYYELLSPDDHDEIGRIAREHHLADEFEEYDNE